MTKTHMRTINIIDPHFDEVLKIDFEYTPADYCNPFCKREDVYPDQPESLDIHKVAYDGSPLNLTDEKLEWLEEQIWSNFDMSEAI